MSGIRAKSANSAGDMPATTGMRHMSRQDANAAFARSSFLYGGNAAYLEDLHAKYEADPNSVDAEWRDFFGSLKDGADAAKSARGASWRKPPLIERTDLLSALDGQWAETEKKISDKVRAKAQGAGVELTAADVEQATRDSLHALMLIRAYRIRGHFHANLDPLGLEGSKDDEELDPRSYGFADEDLDRKIFLDKVLGLEFATMREIVALLKRTYCQTMGIEFMHISNAQQKAWIQERIEGARRRRRVGRREVSPRGLVGSRVRRQQGAPFAHRQSLAPRDRQSGGARQSAREAGSAHRNAGRPHDGDAAADAWRCGFCRPRRGGGMLRPLGPEGLPHRPLDPFYRRQP